MQPTADDLRRIVEQTVSVPPDADLLGLRLVEDLGIDSLGALELRLDIEDWTGRVFTEDEVVSISTLGDLWDWIMQSAVRG